ncbi:nuclear transport factor 2 family protein [Sphingobium sp.]|uniref:nuclear transport factor 2 family protein n=1 Tax=Sphingobium sp. TaxID=1912891 RepID=UPI002CA7794B|nr:nuclear transport factor 2 family protein [Sphingobium sp.]HUD94927.1 nuclear transport factor 2 family protein [Sphingobium sp.]
MNMAIMLAHYEIGRELTRFARAMDDRDWATLKGILTDDATADLGTGMLAGSDAIIALIRQYLDVCGTSQHLLGNLIVEVDGDSATSRAYVSDMHLGPGDAPEPNFRTLGDYHDRWLRIDGCWRLAERRKLNRALIGSMDVFKKERTE